MAGTTQREVLWPFPDDADPAAVQPAAVEEWRHRVYRDRCRPLEEPVAELVTKFASEYEVDPATGAKVKLPDRAWRVVGYVVNDAPRYRYGRRTK